MPSSSSVSSLSAKFAAGVGSVEITPTRQELDAYGQGFKKEALYPGGAAAPLWAKALATRSDGKTVLLITADLLLTPLWMSDAVRTELRETCGLPREAIAICTSQTHGAPYSSLKDPEQPWNQRLVRKLIEVGAKAVADLRPARLGVVKGYNHGIVYNQRLPITEEVPEAVCPDRERHLGGTMFARDHRLGRSGGTAVDHEVGVIRIESAEGKLRAVVFHYNCHPATVIEGPTMHGDYSGFAAEQIEKECPGATALFLQGSLADAHPRAFFTDVEQARRSGRELAAEILRVLPDAKTTDQVRLNYASEPFALTFVPYAPEHLRRLLGYYRDYLRELEGNPQACWLGAGPDTINLPPRFPAEARRNMVTPLIKYCEAKLAAADRGEKEVLTPLDCELQVFTWNDLALCLHNWEMYCQTGLEIKRLSPARYTFPVGNSNSLVGYVAPQHEFERGGYEVITNPMYGQRASMYDPENTVRIVRRFSALLDSAGRG